MCKIIGRMDTWTYEDTRIGTGTEKVFENIVVSKIIGRMDTWTYQTQELEKVQKMFLKILLCLKSLDIWTIGHMRTTDLEKGLKYF